MQTKRQIQQLLESAGIRPNKRLGQHFLIDLNLMRLLIGSADIQSEDVVLEVGCGTGSLTEALAERGGKIIAVEYDRNLAEIALQRFKDYKNVKLLNTDILKSKNALNNTVINEIETAQKQHRGDLLLVANLPYNAASPVMMNLITSPLKADRMVVTVQKEVADRMTASPESSDYGILSIVLDATGDIKTIKTLKSTVFWPQPQVDSAMVSFIRSKEKSGRIKNMGLFVQIVNIFMGHRRKTLSAITKLSHFGHIKINNWTEIFKKCSIDPSQRPETLNADKFINISNCARKSSICT